MKRSNSPKKEVEEKLEPQQPKSAKKKKNPVQMDDETISELVMQKFQEISQQNTSLNEEDIKKIKSKFTKFQQSLTEQCQNMSEEEKTQSLETFAVELVSMLLKYDEQNLQLKRAIKYTKEGIDHFENRNKLLLQQKQKHEQICREIQKNILSVVEVNKKVIDEEEKQRNEITKNFENSLDDINSKITTQDEEGQQIEKENEVLREDLKKRIQDFENREAEIKLVVEEKQNTAKDQNQSLLDKIKSIEQEAKSSMEQRAQYELLSRGETEKKFRIAISQQKQSDYADTLTKTQEMIVKYKQEFLNQTLKLQSAIQQNFQLTEQSEKCDYQLLTINRLNSEQRKFIEKLKHEKDGWREKILKIQTEIKKYK